MKTLKKLNNPYLPAIIGTVALLILGQCLSKGFLSMNNISSILMTTSILTLASIGQAAVIISGDSGLDMSVGAIMSMTALFGPMINVGSGVASFILMIPAVMLMGAVVGAINGTGVQMLKVVPLVMTLIMSNVVDGFSIMVTKGQPSVMVGKELQGISKTLVGPLRILPTVVIIILILLEILFLRRSRYGRSLFLAGNNRNAANLCGINSKKIIILAYVFGGAMAGFAGLMLVGYAGTAQMNMASSYTMLSVAAVVIGGTPMTGGKAHVLGTVVGALIMQMITLTCVMNNIPDEYAQVLKAAIIIFAVFIQREQAK